MPHRHRSLEQNLWDFWHQLTGKQRQLPPPWDENWKLDEKFFKDLADWDNQNPQSTFSGVVKKIMDAAYHDIIPKPKSLLDLIPDAPFPARALVQALSYFLQLDETIEPTGGEGFGFVYDLSECIVEIEETLRDRRGKFSSRTHKSLVQTRNLVNEIFKWGWARLHDGRWVRPIGWVNAADEIQDFNRRLSKAREILWALVDVDMAVGMGMGEVSREIQEIKELQESQLGGIFGRSERTQLENDRRQFPERTPYRYALRDTGYDQQGKGPCDPETRVEILATLEEWVNDVSNESRNFFWLTGDPGSGKSAITASFARDCKENGFLWAQFFINRNNESTTNPRFYFPSIACQMAGYIADPTVTVAIHDILRKKETSLDNLSIEQALEFFVRVVQVACDLDGSKPIVIIFDGLDETSRDLLEDTASVFSQLLARLERDNAKIFISSRTDDEITKPFYGPLQSDSKHVKHLHLDTSESRKDVEIYLRQKLGQLVEEWVLDWKEWPGEEQFQKLCDQAGGLFIWAVTVVKFFRAQLEKHGPERRKKILDVSTERGMGDVNELYGIILEMTIEPGTESDDDWEYEKFRWIVGFIVALKEPLTIGELSGLLDLREKTLDSDTVDVIHFVSQLRTVLVAGTENINNDTTLRLHKSFVEYITSKQASPQFRIDVSVVDGQIATKCLKLVGRLRNAGERDGLAAGSVQYVIQNWTRHLPREGTSKSGMGIVGGEAELEGLWKVLSMPASLNQEFVSVSGDYRTHMYDPATGLPPPVYSNASTIQGSDFIQSIAVSPDSRLIAAGYMNGLVQIWDSRSHKPIGKLDKLQHDRVTSLCFSPDSRWLVSGSSDKSIRLWDCGTGKSIGYLLPLAETRDVNPVCTDGKRIISGSYVGIRIWSVDTHDLTGEPIYTNGSVYAVALSKDGRIAAGVGKNAYIFDIQTRERISLMEGHTGIVWTVAFSLDSSRIASGSADKTIRIWDVQTQEQIFKLDGHSDCVLSVAFSPDGHLITSASRDRTVRLWNSETGHPVGPPLTGHTSCVMAVAFSPDSQIISGSYDHTIRIWSAQPPEQVTIIHLSQQPASSPDNRISLDGHPTVISACLSPNGFLYAASTLDRHISIWNEDRQLLWETCTSIHPIHLLRFLERKLVLSAPDGSTLSWNISDGKPTHEKPISCAPQFNLATTRTSLTKDISWLPFHFDAGLWAYVDGCLVRFERELGSIAIFDLQDVGGQKTNSCIQVPVEAN